MNDALQTGELIGSRYLIKSKIGEGGMQEVFSAQDNVTSRLVAVKTPKNGSAVKRFKRSAILAAKVNHPNVAKTLDYLKVGDRRFLIEELISGHDLHEALLTRSKFIDPHLAAKIFHYLSRGIAAAHHAGVMHRDLKPKKIMVVGGYSLTEIKITDFGIAKMAEEVLEEAAIGGQTTLSQSTTAIGALPYMSPEAIESPKEVTPKTDIWSLGAMISHLLCGETPFGTGLKAVKRITANRLPDVPAFLSSNPQLKPLCLEIISLAHRCLSYEPSNRPSADELVKLCGNFCYSTSPRSEGSIFRMSYGNQGFIATQNGDVFFHSDSYFGPGRLNVGDVVNFASYESDKAPRARRSQI